MDTEFTLAYSLFVFSKGQIKPEEFYAMDDGLKAIYVAFLDEYAERQARG